MDQLTKIRIMRYLLTDPTLGPGYTDTFLNHFPDLNAEIINATLIDLQDESIVSLTMGGGGIVYATVRPKAWGYIREIEEAEAQRIEAARSKKAEKWDDRKWGIKMAAFGYVAGFISGVVSLWVKATFFP